MITATVSDRRLRVQLTGSDALWAFKRRIDVPVEAVLDVRVAEDLSPWLGMRDNELGLRVPGTAVPWLIVAGSYWRRGVWRFCSVRRGDRTLVVDLEPGDWRYRRLVLGMEDPEAARRQIESARGPAGGTVSR